MLRVGINFGNALLAKKDAATGMPTGIAVDLAEELGRALCTPIEVVGYHSASVMADDVADGAWDVAFLAADPGRLNDISFSESYLEIDATYLVPSNSPLRTVADVDREGVRIAVSDRSAYDLFLTRTIRHAQLVRAPSVDASVSLFFDQKLEALAGLKPLLVGVTDRYAGTTVLQGRFTEVRQAIGVPAGSDSARVEAFIRHAKASGLVARSIERHGVRGVVVPVS